MKTYKLTSRVQKPALLIFFETQEWAVIGVGYFIGVTSGGWWYLAIVLLPAIIIPYSRSKPRGFFGHLAVKNGVKDMAGVPPLFVRDFKE